MDDLSIHEVARQPLSPRAWTTWLLSIFGLGISIYLTLAHYSSSVSLSCPLSTKGGFVNCAKVTTSPESIVFGIPVAVLGLAYYLGAVVIMSPWAWRSSREFVAPLRLASTIVSVGFISYLIYAELYVIHSICIWCTTVHVLTFIIFVLVVTGWDEAIAARWPGGDEETDDAS